MMISKAQRRRNKRQRTITRLAASAQQDAVPVAVVPAITFSRNLGEHITKVRLLVGQEQGLVSPRHSSWHVVTLYHVRDEHELNVDVSYKSMLRLLARPGRIGRACPVSFVLRVDLQLVRTKREAIQWARMHMRGGYKRMFEDENFRASDSVRCFKFQRSTLLVWCRREISNLRSHLSEHASMATVASMPSKAFCWIPALHCTTPDGICTHRCKRCYIAPYYTTRGVIRSMGEEYDKDNYKGVSDEKLLGYSESTNHAINSLIRETEGDDDGGTTCPLQVWDLETRGTLNWSACETLDIMWMSSDAAQELAPSLAQHDPSMADELKHWVQEPEVRKLVTREAIVQDKYVRTVEGPLYARGWHRWEACWERAASFLVQDANLHTPIVDLIIRGYAKPERITADDIRRMRVQRWFDVFQQR